MSDECEHDWHVASDRHVACANCFVDKRQWEIDKLKAEVERLRNQVEYLFGVVALKESVINDIGPDRDRCRSLLTRCAEMLELVRYPNERWIIERFQALDADIKKTLEGE